MRKARLPAPPLASSEKFREADGGTLFLDEIGELPAAAQVKLLRVLQQHEVDPVGAGRPVAVDVRVISATNRDLTEEVRAGRFRQDLYYRLNVLHLTVPPLRERQADILPLAQYFLARIAARERMPARQPDTQAETWLRTYGWPGNVRELENVMERLMITGENETFGIDEVDIAGIFSTADEENHPERTSAVAPLPLRHSGVRTAPAAAPLPVLSLFDAHGFPKPLEALEREAMDCLLAWFSGNVTRTSAALGIAKSTFYRKRKAGTT